MYQIMYQIKFIKCKNLGGPFIIFLYLQLKYKNNKFIKLINLILNHFIFAFPVESNWVSAMNFGVLNRIVNIMQQLFELIGIFQLFKYCCLHSIFLIYFLLTWKFEFTYVNIDMCSAFIDLWIHPMFLPNQLVFLRYIILEMLW